jgi:hypothetical protein
VKSRVWLGLGGALLTAGALAPAPANAESSFTALSSATTVDVTVSNTDFPVVTAIEAAGPSSGSSLDSTGQGTAFAADPYPGTTVAELPGVVAGLTGLPIPADPTYVATTSDDSPAEFVKPGIELQAACTSGTKPRCRASALSGSDPATTTAHASITQSSSDAVTATAQATTSDLSIPGGVTLSGVFTSATAELSNGRLRRRSDLTVSRLTVAGTPAFSLSGGKLVVAGTEAPVPFSSLVAALRSVGVEATLFAASSTKDGIVAPVLRLSTVLPGAPAVLSKPSRVVYTLGGADASVSLGTFRPTAASKGGSPGSAGPATTTGPPVSNGASAPSLTSGAAPGASSIAPEPVVAFPSAPAPLARAAGASFPSQPFDLADVYLALVLSAVVWFGATQAIRIFGVRFQWTS